MRLQAEPSTTPSQHLLLVPLGSPYQGSPLGFDYYLNSMPVMASPLAQHQQQQSAARLTAGDEDGINITFYECIVKSLVALLKAPCTCKLLYHCKSKKSPNIHRRKCFYECISINPYTCIHEGNINQLRSQTWTNLLIQACQSNCIANRTAGTRILPLVLLGMLCLAGKCVKHCVRRWCLYSQREQTQQREQERKKERVWEKERERVRVTVCVWHFMYDSLCVTVCVWKCVSVHVCARVCLCVFVCVFFNSDHLSLLSRFLWASTIWHFVHACVKGWSSLGFGSTGGISYIRSALPPQVIFLHAQSMVCTQWPSFFAVILTYNECVKIFAASERVLDLYV